jgi:hypothetical protein
MNDSPLKSVGRSSEDALRMASAYPLDVLRSVWLMLVPEPRASSLEEAHHQLEGAPR